jgi:hypothetical protein
MKKTVIILSSISLLMICLVVILFYKYVDMACLEVYINENVVLSKPLNVDEIYHFEFSEGEDFYIFNYDSDNDIKYIIQKNGFKKITKNNLDEITKVLNIYRDDLCEKELNLFDKTTNISDLAKIGNYYLYSLDMDIE